MKREKPHSENVGQGNKEKYFSQGIKGYRLVKKETKNSEQ